MRALAELRAPGRCLLRQGHRQRTRCRRCAPTASPCCRRSAPPPSTWPTSPRSPAEPAPPRALARGLPVALHSSRERLAGWIPPAPLRGDVVCWSDPSRRTSLPRRREPRSRLGDGAMDTGWHAVSCVSQIAPFECCFAVAQWRASPRCPVSWVPASAGMTVVGSRPSPRTSLPRRREPRSRLGDGAMDTGWHAAGCVSQIAPFECCFVVAQWRARPRCPVSWVPASERVKKSSKWHAVNREM